VRPPTLPALVAAATLLPAAAWAAVEIKQEPDKVTVAIAGAPFTEFHFTGAPHVYYYPVFGPNGEKITRSWPMEDVPTEEHDHPHHRSLWFAHGEVNGVDFWAEAQWRKPGAPPPKIPVGQIVHDKFLEVKGGEKEGVISSQNRWEAPDGTVLLTAVETIRFYDNGAPERMFDFEETLTAGAKDAVMGDSKEGSMAMRLAESMRVAQPKTKPPGQGHMINAEGIKDTECWGKRSAWVDYSGPIAGKTLGVAIFDHPHNARHPTRWHARDYGLFAVNPFCNAGMDKEAPPHSGDVTIPAGKSLTLKYRFLIHNGDAADAKIANRFSEYNASFGSAGKFNFNIGYQF
jgi:hypothetical protein